MVEWIALHLWPLLGAVVALGGVAILILVVALGVPAALIVANLLRAFGEVVRFIATPAGQVALIAAVCVAAFLAGDMHRARVDAKHAHAAAIAAEKAIAERSAKIRAEVEADAAAKQADIDKQIADMQAKVTDYETQLAAQNVPVAACVVTDDDARRLRWTGSDGHSSRRNFTPRGLRKATRWRARAAGG